MTTLEMAKLEPSWQLAELTGPPLIGELTATPAELAAAEARAMRLEGPSTLTLALIGVATLAAYRGIQKRLTSRATAADAVRKPIKPRRRAA
jgi:hypothetical protein